MAEQNPFIDYAKVKAQDEEYYKKYPGEAKLEMRRQERKQKFKNFSDKYAQAEQDAIKQFGGVENLLGGSGDAATGAIVFMGQPNVKPRRPNVQVSMGEPQIVSREMPDADPMMLRRMALSKMMDGPDGEEMVEGPGAEPDMDPDDPGQMEMNKRLTAGADPLASPSGPSRRAALLKAFEQFKRKEQ